MKWRRGLVFAGIHLAIAGTLGWWQFAVRDSVQKTWGSAAGLSGVAFAAQEEQSVSFNPCEGWVHYSNEEHLLMGLDLPATLVTGNMNPCPSSWTVSALVQSPGNPYTRRNYERVAVAFVALVALQWSLVGSFPLRNPRRWWGEPGAFITLCGCAGGGPLVVFALVALIELKAAGQLWRAPEVLGILAELAGVVATFAWFWWFGLLVWRVVRKGWMVVRVRVA